MQNTFDALCGDLPKRYAHMLGDDGFRYLINQGVVYSNVHYQYANIETIGDIKNEKGNVYFYTLPYQPYWLFSIFMKLLYR